MIVFDTCAIIELLSGSRKGEELKHKFESETLAISSIALFELFSGMSESQQNLFLKLVDDFNILVFDLPSAIEGAKIQRNLKKKGRPVSKLDFLIAGSCISKNLPIVTFDKHFKKIPGLDCVLLS